ncbi:hypothetical protein [Rhodoplanes sp. SY1]|uniref:hypothetical protein n=1 Tax=Rhodoplanes sp. SY1 TaxID=3166646 RepID=UPI0038B6A689
MAERLEERRRPLEPRAGENACEPSAVDRMPVAGDPLEHAVGLGRHGAAADRPAAIGGRGRRGGRGVDGRVIHQDQRCPGPQRRRDVAEEGELGAIDGGDPGDLALRGGPGAGLSTARLPGSIRPRLAPSVTMAATMVRQSEASETDVDPAQRRFGDIVGHAQAADVGDAGERGPALQRVVDRLGSLALGGEFGALAAIQA